MTSAVRAAGVCALLAWAPAARAEEAPARPRTSPVLELLVASTVTAAASPVVLTGARALGTSTPELATSALPAMLVALAVPPAIATAGLALERRREGAGTKLLPTFFTGVAVQGLVLAGAVLARTYVGEARDMWLLSAAQGVALGGATTIAAELAF